MNHLTGLIGYPVSHSKSPLIHAAWIAQYQLDADYKLFTTPPNRLRQIVHRLRDKGARGFNVTVPHKQAVMEYLDGVDDVAKRIGAVNTVINQQGTFTGTNTDAYGFITNLQEKLGDLKPYLKNIVILGAGGATRAAIVALQDVGAAQITLINRSADKAQTLAQEFDVAALPWEVRDDALSDTTLLINTTSLGMEGQPELSMNVSLLPEGAAVHDIVYAPLETELLKNARARGLLAVDGLGMLLYQAQKAFELWHGILPKVTPELRAHVLEPSDEQSE